MNPKYKDWIAANITKNPYGECHKYAKLMVESFPELKMVRGHYYCSTWGERGHWWCVDQDNNIVDPTASQFPSEGNGIYVEWDETQKEPTGLCLNCGEYTYNEQTFCCEDCEIATRAEFNSYLR